MSTKDDSSKVTLRERPMKQKQQRKQQNSIKSSNKGLSQRKDVATKTAIRSLKWFVRAKFEEMFPMEDRSNSLVVIEHIESFANYFLSDYTETAANLRVTFIEVVHFIINLIDPMMYRWMKLDSPAREAIDIY